MTVVAVPAMVEEAQVAVVQATVEVVAVVVPVLATAEETVAVAVVPVTVEETAVVAVTSAVAFDQISNSHNFKPKSTICNNNTLNYML